MFRCLLCRFLFRLDDTITRSAAGACICLGCFLRETGHTERLNVRWRRAFEAALAEISGVAWDAI